MLLIEPCSYNWTILSLFKEPRTISEFTTTVLSIISFQYPPKQSIAPSLTQPSYWFCTLLPFLFGTLERTNACLRWRESGQLVGPLRLRPS